MIKDRLCCEVFWNQKFPLVTNKTIDDYKNNISKDCFIEEICFYYDIFVKNIGNKSCFKKVHMIKFFIKKEKNKR
ncbi:hypothetical protein HMPREF9466_01597 [Fusobacterium necrophorum subsp. funduliforme 1_1_36S]|nr:hypothetical protein HMPREF9466_01597 [Fusobacterium necrophorum subsp. funduliforme 1_1_36S]